MLAHSLGLAWRRVRRVTNHSQDTAHLRLKTKDLQITFAPELLSNARENLDWLFDVSYRCTTPTHKTRQLDMSKASQTAWPHIQIR